MAKEAGQKAEENAAVKEIDDNSNSKPTEKKESRDNDMYQVGFLLQKFICNDVIGV